MPKQNERGNEPATAKERAGEQAKARQRTRSREATPTSKRSGGSSWGNLAVVTLAVGALGFLLYSSFKAEHTPAAPAPESAPQAQSNDKPKEQPANTQKPVSAAGSEWNDGQINWLSFEAGLAKAKAENKPACLVFYTGWCPHCRNYAKVFQDPKIVEKSRDLVMIRLNADDEEAISARYAPDGTYVPRTFFLASDGSIMSDVHEARPQYLYFYNENNPASLLAGMDAALRKAARPM